jgi:glutamine synthetase
MRRDSAVDIATDYGLDNREVGVRVPVGSIIFSSPRSRNRPRGPSANYPKGAASSYLGFKRPERETDHSPPSSAEA